MNAMKKLTDEAVVERVKAGETLLFELIMRRHNQKLYRIARGMGASDADCDDLIQQCYIRAYSKLHQFNGSSAFSTWLVRILINECLMARRKSRSSITDAGELQFVDELLELPTIQETPETQMLRDEVRRVLEQAMEGLPSDYRIVYVMRELEGMSIREIADALKITEVNVKVRLLRARAKLRSSLKQYLGPHELYDFGNARCDKVVRSVMASIDVERTH